MAINLSTNTLNPVDRNVTFSETINVTVDGKPPEVISSITVSLPSLIIIMTEDENENTFIMENSGHII